MKSIFVIAAASVFISGCAGSGGFNRINSPRNPYPTLSTPAGSNSQQVVNPFIQANYNVLLEATDLANNNRTLRPVGSDNMKRYINAGFALSDIYCEQFFRSADETLRRRRFGRATTNDVGTAITAVLGLANAGQNIVTGVATSFGLADSVWRNYDDAFLVSPDLSNVRSLVMSAQDNFRQRTLTSDETLPEDYGLAQSVIQRYANLCSTLGMQSLLNQSTMQQSDSLDRQTTDLRRSNNQGLEGDVETVPNGLIEPQAAVPAVPSG